MKLILTNQNSLIHKIFVLHWFEIIIKKMLAHPKFNIDQLKHEFLICKSILDFVKLLFIFFSLKYKIVKINSYKWGVYNSWIILCLIQRIVYPSPCVHRPLTHLILSEELIDPAHPPTTNPSPTLPYTTHQYLSLSLCVVTPQSVFFFLATIYVNTLISCMLSFLNFNSSFDHWSMLVNNCDFLWYFIIDPCFYEIWCIIMKLSCEFNHWSALENLVIFIRCWSCKRFF